ELPGGLGAGPAGLVLLFAELARTDPAHRPAARAWLAVAAERAEADRTARPGLHDSLPALSFALHRVAEGPGEHRVDRARLGTRLALLVGQRTAAEQARIARGTPCPSREAFDLVAGLAGLGAHLLDRHEAGETTPLESVLTALVALTRPLARYGLPGWWVAEDPQHRIPVVPRAGHAGLGLAHGLSGPLALLALAWRAGVEVPGQAEAIRTLAEWLLARQRTDQAGPWWPLRLRLGELRGPAERPDPAEPDWAAGPDGPLAWPGAPRLGAPRPSWCSGSPGIARALQLAGTALGVPRWRAVAVGALRAALERPAELAPPLTGAGLCHGWAGLLQTGWRVAAESGSPELAARLPRLTQLLLDRCDPGFPFAVTPPDRPSGPGAAGGLLTGAAGVALALHTVATGAAPATTWDRALLLA
ncbi:lanthionine synthetase C family protein, partial [Kitasatospora sp. LaBMicrA B282]|uniref:lanthionine synthetase C family protein n=1 Tax=Kitasatospora sp. LaBMicrA B282 TaxID=3420949 RepID=UPI003D12FDBB